MRLTHLSIVILIFFCACQSDPSEKAADTDITKTTSAEDTANTVKPTVDNPEEGLPELKDSLSLNELIPDGYSSLSDVSGYLNDDTLTDIAMVISKEDEMDSKILLAFFKNPNQTYNATLITTGFITVRYDNELEISDRRLLVRSDHPWHGSNICSYDLRYVKNDWFCFSATSNHDYANHSWDNNVNYATGKFSVRHEVTTADNQTHEKKVEGTLANAKPFSATKDNEIDALEISYDGEKYAMWDRNDLWEDDEILKLLPTKYQELIGGWSSSEKHPSNISLLPDGNYNMNMYNEESQQDDFFNGLYSIHNDSLIIDVNEYLIIKREKGEIYLTDKNEIKYIKDKE